MITPDREKKTTRGEPRKEKDFIKKNLSDLYRGLSRLDVERQSQNRQGTAQKSNRRIHCHPALSKIRKHTAEFAWVGCRQRCRIALPQGGRRKLPLGLRDKLPLLWPHYEFNQSEAIRQSSLPTDRQRYQ
jgi:hypothetical protein